MYKKGLTKSRYKKRLRDFWKCKWKYIFTPEQWTSLLREERSSLVNGVTITWRHHSKFDGPSKVVEFKRLLLDAVDKLILEKKLQKKDEKRLTQMIESPDRESVLLAISIMAGVKPKMFKEVTT